jgi:hypothetical protein
MMCRVTNHCSEIHKGKGKAVPLHAKHARKEGVWLYLYSSLVLEEVGWSTTPPPSGKRPGTLCICDVHQTYTCPLWAESRIFAHKMVADKVATGL